MAFQCNCKYCKSTRETFQEEWDRGQHKNVMHEGGDRRKIANEIHEQIDELEVQIQQLRSQQNDTTNTSTGTFATTKSSLLASMNSLSDSLDKIAETSAAAPSKERDGPITIQLIEDRVAKMILKSARSKVERPMTTLSEDTK